jgi:hypothetical protein
MVQLWHSDNHGEWNPSEFDKGQIHLSARTLLPLRRKSHRSLLISSGTIGNSLEWLLFLPPDSTGQSPDVKLNGVTIIAGLVHLNNKDFLRSATAECFFTTQRLQALSTYEGKAVSCPRCRLQIVEGTRVVVCTQCRAVHHQNEEMACWTFAETCTLCSERVDLESRTYGWTPNGL